MILRNSKGFTLIELLIVIVVLSIFGTGFYKVRTVNLLAQKNQVLEQKAIWILQSQAALVRSSPFAELKAAENMPLSALAQGTMNLPGLKAAITVRSLAKNLKRIDLNLQWKNVHGAARKRTLTLYRRSS